MMKRLILAAAIAIGVRSNTAAQVCPTCIQNTGAPQNAQMNITSATVRGTLTVGGLLISTISVSTITAGAVIASGTYITDLNASQLLSGTVPAARVVGAYPGITSVGPLSAGVWNGSVISSRYGGTGANLITASTGGIPYFSAVGTMSALAPATAGFILQTNGPASAPSWTGAPQVQGANITAIPMANLVTGELPTAISVNDASISTVSAAKVVGSIPGNAANINGILAIGQLGAGVLSTSNPASSVTASGVTAGIYGGPQKLIQATVAYDGRITAISHSTFTVYAASIAAGALPVGVTIGASQIAAGALGASVRASSIAASGVTPGSYGMSSQSAMFTVGVDGRITSSSQTPIAINTSQINNGTLTAGVVVPAANVQAGSLAGNVVASSLAANGVSPGTYGSGTNSVQIAVGPDGRITSVSQFPIPNGSTSTSGFAITSVDNNWSHSQTFQASVTVNSSLMASALAGDGFNITDISPSNIAAGVLSPTVVASSISVAFIRVPSSVTASTYFGDGSNLTGITTGACQAGGGDSVLCQGLTNVIAGTANVVSGGQYQTISNGPTGSGIGSGSNNLITASYSVIPGGILNEVNAPFGFAAGQRAKANNIGTFVWADTAIADFASTVDNSFIIRAFGGVGINTASPATALDVNGTVNASGFTLNSIAPNLAGGLLKTSNSGVVSYGVAGQAFTLSAYDYSQGTGGNIILNPVSGTVSGTAEVRGGNNNTTGGGADLLAGNAAGGNQGGSVRTTGGNFGFSGAGGDVNIAGGNGGGGASGGSVSINTGSGGTSGTITMSINGTPAHTIGADRSSAFNGNVVVNSSMTASSFYGQSLLLNGGSLNAGDSLTVSGSSATVDGLLHVGWEHITNSCGGAATTCTATCSAGKYAMGGGCDSAAVLGVAVLLSDTGDASSHTCTTVAATTLSADVYCSRIAP